MKRVWVGRVLGGFAVLFLLFDAALKLLELAPAVETTAGLGYPPELVFALGVVELACLVLYAVPRTSLPGAVLLTAYLGGAVATHVRVGSPLLSHTLFPLYVGLFVWGGLLLRDARVRDLVSLSLRPE